MKEKEMIKIIREDLMLYAKYQYLDDCENRTEKREKKRKDICWHFKIQYEIRLFESNPEDVYKAILKGRID